MEHYQPQSSDLYTVINHSSSAERKRWFYDLQDAELLHAPTVVASQVGSLATTVEVELKTV